MVRQPNKCSTMIPGTFCQLVTFTHLFLYFCHPILIVHVVYSRVLYFSIHGYQNGKFWPHLRESDYHYIGRGAGAGYNINVPLNEIKMSDCDYMAIIEQLLLPIASEVWFKKVFPLNYQS